MKINGSAAIASLLALSAPASSWRAEPSSSAFITRTSAQHRLMQQPMAAASSPLLHRAHPSSTNPSRDDSSFPTLSKKLDQLLLSEQTVQMMSEQLYRKGYCEFDPGKPVLFELAQYMASHRGDASHYTQIAADEPVCQKMVVLANALMSHDPFRVHSQEHSQNESPLNTCHAQITRWESGVPPQAWHQDSPMDRMVWLLTGYGEPTWYLERETADEYCYLEEASEISIAPFQCDLPQSEVSDPDHEGDQGLIKKGSVGKFLIFLGRQEGPQDAHQKAIYSLVHKGPGTLEAPEGRGTVRVSFD